MNIKLFLLRPGAGLQILSSPASAVESFNSSSLEEFNKHAMDATR